MSSGLHLMITGAGGLIGSALLPRLAADGHRITRVTRGPAEPGEISWDPGGGILDLHQLGRIDGVIHLAGENIGSRWTATRKRRILQSRTLGTGLLSQALSRLQSRPEVLISASAVGIYGDRGNELLTESSAPGNPEQDFLVRVCLEWEAAAEPAREAGIRVVHPRFGVVLSPEGGALAKLLPPFRLGLGGPQGHGYQWMSWIAIDDVVGAIRHLLDDRQLSGPLNVTAPGAVVNRHFMQIVGRVIRRPTLV
ncbi:MAG TPA: TIGR01777 family oxidoreductase, partial [Gemmatimonadales bacterium]